MRKLILILLLVYIEVSAMSGGPLSVEPIEVPIEAPVIPIEEEQPISPVTIPINDNVATVPLESQVSERGLEQLMRIRSSSKPRLGRTFPKQYDALFQDASKRYMPGYPWTFLKSQCYQESKLIPDAVSYVGASGICQFMPGTWSDVQRQMRLPTIATAFDPSYAIHAAAFYNAQLLRTWSAPRPPMDRLYLALASYNAGAGHLIKSQRICGGNNLYDEIVICLPEVTGQHSVETMTYVERIKVWQKEMLFD